MAGRSKKPKRLLEGVKTLIERRDEIDRQIAVAWEYLIYCQEYGMAYLNATVEVRTRNADGVVMHLAAGNMETANRLVAIAQGMARKALRGSPDMTAEELQKVQSARFLLNRHLWKKNGKFFMKLTYRLPENVQVFAHDIANPDMTPLEIAACERTEVLRKVRDRQARQAAAATPNPE